MPNLRKMEITIDLNENLGHLCGVIIINCLVMLLKSSQRTTLKVYRHPVKLNMKVISLVNGFTGLLITYKNAFELDALRALQWPPLGVRMEAFHPEEGVSPSGGRWVGIPPPPLHPRTE